MKCVPCQEIDCASLSFPWPPPFCPIRPGGESQGSAADNAQVHCELLRLPGVWEALWGDGRGVSAPGEVCGPGGTVALEETQPGQWTPRRWGTYIYIGIVWDLKPNLENILSLEVYNPYSRYILWYRLVSNVCLELSWPVKMTGGANNNLTWCYTCVIDPVSSL